MTTEPCADDERLAPEQIRQQTVNARADLFSLGCVLYRMATGRPAFSGGDFVAVLLSVAVDQPPPPREVNPEVPPALAKLIQQLLATDGFYQLAFNAAKR